jgi:hypothetical protein
MNTRSLFAFAIVSMITGAAYAEDSFEQSLVAREIELIEAIKQQDRAALKELLGGQAFAVTTDGGRQTEPELQRSLEKCTISSYRMEDVRCVPIGPDVGILTYQYTWAGAYDGQVVPAKTVFATSTWAQRDGEWKSVFYQETPINQLQTVSTE